MKQSIAYRLCSLLANDKHSHIYNVRSSSLRKQIQRSSGQAHLVGTFSSSPTSVLHLPIITNTLLDPLAPALFSLTKLRDILNPLLSVAIGVLIGSTFPDSTLLDRPASTQKADIAHVGTLTAYKDINSTKRGVVRKEDERADEQERV